MPPGNSTPANILNRQVGGIAAHRIEPPYVDVALDPSSQDFGVAVAQKCRTVTRTIQRDDGRTVTRKERRCD